MDVAISYSRPMRVLLGVLGLGPRWTRLVVDDADVEIHMGWAFQARFPRAAVVAVRPWPTGRRRPASRGAHGWGGRWLVNGSADGLVVVTIDPVARARTIGFPVKLRELTVSVTDPDALVGGLSAGAR
jgi:hypothetical protein